MKLKGNYSADASYSIGDIVIFDGVVYYKFQDGIAGSPKDTHCWLRLNQPLAESVMLMMDVLAMANENTAASIEKYFIDDQTLILTAGEGEDEKSYAITVDASGDTPELAVAEVEEEAST